MCSLINYTHFLTKVANLGEYVLMWKQAKRVLTAGKLVVRKDSRIRLREDNALEISGLRAEDQGTYVCEVDILGRPISIRHTVKTDDCLRSIEPKLAHDNQLFIGPCLPIRHLERDFVSHDKTIKFCVSLFKVEVLVPPAVQAIPREGTVVKRKGSKVILRCSGTGNPNPRITWTKKVTISSPNLLSYYCNQGGTITQFVVHARAAPLPPPSFSSSSNIG